MIDQKKSTLMCFYGNMSSFLAVLTVDLIEFKLDLKLFLFQYCVSKRTPFMFGFVS